MEKLSFHNYVIVITGAGSGMGKDYALYFSSNGAKVVVNDIGIIKTRDGLIEKTAEITVREIKSKGGVAVANYDSVEEGEKIIQTAIVNFGKVDVLINNAGVLFGKAFKEIEKSDWETLMRIHLNGMYACSKAAWPIFIKQNFGRIINVSSPAGLYGTFRHAAYTTAKAGVFGFTKTLVKEGEKYNIRTNCIAPFAYTQMAVNVMPNNLINLLKVEYVTPVVAYFSHKECLENGWIFEVAGGFVAKVRFQRTEGVFFGPNFTAEKFKEKIKQVCDFKGKCTYNDEDETSLSIVANAFERLKDDKYQVKTKF